MSASTLELCNKSSIFSDEELSLFDPIKGPKHIAIIMDGNRRWAKEKGVPSMLGHWEGAETLTDVTKGAAELGVKTLTVYAFSTENWARPAEEVDDLMKLFELYLVGKKESMIHDGVRLDAIGDLSFLPKNVLAALDETRKATAHCEKINLVLALNYGGRDEIRRAVVKILQDNVDPASLTEDLFSSYLDTSRFGDPDFLIRTSGEMRVSNFLLWQISYAEIFSSDVLWPDFSSKHLLEALIVYQNRNRKLGG